MTMFNYPLSEGGVELKVFIGYDPRQPIAFQVAAQSLWEHVSAPVSITRLELRTLPIRRRGLTEFTYSRFLVPYLSGYEGYSLFLDSDMLIRADVLELLPYFQDQPKGGVFIVRHPEKRFEWSSVMLFRNKSFPHLTPEFINDTRNCLYDWKWAGDPVSTLHEGDWKLVGPPIGELPARWNHLVGYDEPDPEAKIVHFTRGIPVWKETIHCEFAQEWIDTFRRSTSSVSFDALMGPSVHAAGVRAGR